MHTYIYKYMYMYTHTHTHTYIYIYIYMQVCEWQEPVWYKLKSGGQRMQRNPKMFLRKDCLGS